MNSITYRITGLMFLMTAGTVGTLLYLTNMQMSDLFQEYLLVQQMQAAPDSLTSHSMISHMIQGNRVAAASMEAPEYMFLASAHKSLIWVGGGILILGLLISYALARSITVPLRNLSGAVELMRQGNLSQKVPVESTDEVGQLAAAFNRMTETLAANNRLRQQFLANIAHELRTPVAIIQGNLEGIQDGIVEPTAEQFASLHEEAVRLNRLITDLRDLSLAEVGQLTLEMCPIDINYLVNRAVLILRSMAKEKGITVACSLENDLPEVTVDADRMTQVIYNILANAIRYTPAHGTVKVNTTVGQEQGNNCLEILVQDNGPGIAPEDVPYIFGHFYRGEKSRNRKSGGSGLGLAIVKHLVELQGGKVTVQSTLGEGSLFRVIVPIK